MDAKIRDVLNSVPAVKDKILNFFSSVTDFFVDHIPWSDRDTISAYEREVSEAANGASDEVKSESIMRLSWALVHSREPEDVKRGITMLEASLANSSSPLQKREKLYLLAVGYYRSSQYPRSIQLAEQCLEIAPDWRQALNLKKAAEDQIIKDRVILIGIGLLALRIVKEAA